MRRPVDRHPAQLTTPVGNLRAGDCRSQPEKQ